MSQISLIREESRKRGAKRTIKVPAIVASGMLQYTKDHDKLKGVIKTYGAFNSFVCINNDVVDVEVALDFAEGKTYPIPKTSSLSIDEIMYQEFNLRNLDAGAAVTANKITIIASYEAPLIREKIQPKKLLGGY